MKIESLLLANKALIKVIRCRVYMSSLMNYSPCSGLLSCYCKCLLSALILFFYGSIVCAAI